MMVEKVKLSDLKLDLKNLRQHKEADVELLSRSLTVFGQYKPLLVDKDTMTVKVGNGRLMAMRKLGWAECHCVLLDWSDKAGLEVIDNRLNELSSWVDKDLKKWFGKKGDEWWGIDDAMKPRVEKYVKEESKSKRKKEGDNSKHDIAEPVKHLCPHCQSELKKKKSIILT